MGLRPYKIHCIPAMHLVDPIPMAGGPNKLNCCLFIAVSFTLPPIFFSQVLKRTHLPFRYKRKLQAELEDDEEDRAAKMPRMMDSGELMT